MRGTNLWKSCRFWWTALSSREIALENPKIDLKSSTLTLQAAGRSIELKRPLTIGREPDCDVRIEDHRVGDRHAEIYPVGKAWWIRDLGSDNGVFVNGEIVEAALLEAKSEVRLGTNGPTLLLNAL